MAFRKSSKRARQRRPGRPAGLEHTEAVRLALLNAARKLFAVRDFKSVSVRDIAQAAQVNPAMVHYHFTDKQGLYKAMLQETIGPIVGHIQALITNPASDRESGVRLLMKGAMTTFAKNPWVPALIVREVLAQEGEFREMFIKEFASRAGGRLPALLNREKELGRVRRDLDATLGALSILGLVVFPFVALPVAERVFGFTMDEEFVRRLVEHTQKLLEEGIS
jgi:AcrR family transcriptional regulator